MNSLGSPFSGGRIPGLDGIRGIAILSVLVFHSNKLTNGLGRILQFLTHGVDLFFVLSGFLITGLLLDAKDKPNYFRNFYARRALRIFPLYYSSLIFVFLIIPLLPGKEFLAVPFSAQWRWWFFAANFRFPYQGLFSLDLLPHFWSLAIEEQFYIFWPAIILLLSRRSLAALCFSLVLLSFCVRVGLRFVGADPADVTTITSCRVDTLAVGAILAIALRDAWAAAILKTQSKLFLQTSIATLLFLIGLGVINANYGTASFFNQTIGFTLIAFSSAGLINAAIHSSPDSRFRRALTSAPLLLLGKYSFALYVFHYVIWTYPIQPFIDSLGVSPSAAAQLAMTSLLLALSLLLAAISWRFLEQPFLRLKRDFL